MFSASAFQHAPRAAGPSPSSELQRALSYEAWEAGPGQSFADFRHSPRFQQVCDQFLERLDQCEQFAQIHFSRIEARQITQSLQVFRQRLLDGQGERYFGDALPLLYSIGKRSLDTFCLRLAQEDIELHQRKTALREMAAQLQACRSTGPAFIEAANALDQDLGGLRGEFLLVVTSLVDALLQQFVHQETSAAKRPWLQSMEVHVINRLKLELDLPGAQANDRFSLGTSLLRAGQLQRCVVLLRQRLRPVTVASQLAQRYRERLLDGVARSLALPPGHIDPDEHLPIIRQEAERLGATYGGISMHSLLDHDPDSGQASWRSDLSLVALDLLRELIRQKLVVQPQQGTLMTDAGSDQAWELCHVDFRLFHIAEPLPGTLERAPHNVGMHHYVRWRTAQTDSATQLVRGGLTETVLSAQSPQALMAFQPNWLESADHARFLLHRLGAARVVAWARQHTISESALALLLRAATAVGHGGLLTMLSAAAARPDRPARSARSAAELVRLAGGPGILAHAVAQGERTVVQYWHTQLGPMVPAMTPQALAQAFTSRNGQPVASTALLAGNPEVLDMVMVLLGRARMHGQLTDAALHQHVRTSVQEAMRRGHVDALKVWGDHLTNMARRGWLKPAILQGLLEGRQVGAGCQGALAGGHAACVYWFLRLVMTLTEKELLRPSQAAMMVASEGSGPEPGDGAAQAVQHNHGDALRTFLDLVVDAAVAGRIDREWLGRLLTCPRNRVHSLGVMLGRPDDRCLPGWLDAVLKASRMGCLTSAATAALVAANSPAGTPYVRGMSHASLPDFSLAPWLTVVEKLVRGGALLRRHVPALLEARGPRARFEHSSALHAALTEWEAADTAAQFVTLYAAACRSGLIDGPSLERLLLAMNVEHSLSSSLVTAIIRRRRGAVHSYLQALITASRSRVLEGDRLARLLDGRGLGQCTALFAAVMDDEPHLLQTVLAATLEAAQAGLITGEQWLQLLLPDGMNNILDALAQRVMPDRIDVVRNAVNTAHGLHIISQEDRLRLRQRLDLVALQVDGHRDRLGHS